MPGMMGGRRMMASRQKVDMKKNVGRLMKSFRKYLPQLIVSFVCVSISVVISIVAPQFLKDLTNEMTDGAAIGNINLDKIGEISVVLVTFYISNALMTFISGFVMSTISQRYCFDLRSDISDKINKMKLKYFDGHAHGDTLSIITNDVDQIGQSMQQSITMLFQSVLMLIGVLIAMFITSWQMALAALGSIPVVMLILMFIMKIAMPLFVRRQKQVGYINGVIEENFTGHMLIRAYNAEATKGVKFDEANEKLHWTMFKAQIAGGMMQPLLGFVSYFSYAAICLVGGLLLANDAGGITFGTITAFMIYINLFQSPMTQIAQSMNSLQMAAASAERVFGLLDEEEQEDESMKEKKLDTKVLKGEVEFKNVKFGYNEDRVIIPDFTAKVKPGMKVAIVGPTGAGKTTIVNLLMRFYEVLDGDILIDGVSIKEMSRNEVRSVFGMVLQDTWMFEGTLRDNIVFNKEGVTEEELNRVLEEANLSYLVSTLKDGVDTRLTEESSLSSGQKQLVTIARAMIENAPLLILDEATSNVDTRTEIEIQEAMDKLTKGRTSFVIAHRLSTIRNADMILVMKDGNIIETGNHNELVAQNGFYAGLYNSQFNMN